MKQLFIDESGTHTLEPKKIDPTFPFFVLTGIVFETEEYKKFQKKLLVLKKEIFGTEKVVLHSLELTRTAKAKQPELKIIANPQTRKNFYEKLDVTIKSFDFSIIQFIIDKKWYGKQFAVAPDPYFLSFNFIFDRYEKMLSPREQGSISIEQRNASLDKQFLLAWESAQTEANHKLVAKLKSHNIAKPDIVKKSYLQNGLELADIVSYRLSRIIQHKENKPIGNEIDIKLLLKKIVAIGTLPKDMDIGALTSKKG